MDVDETRDLPRARRLRLARGRPACCHRSATKLADYDTAIAAFTTALEIVPDVGMCDDIDEQPVAEVDGDHLHIHVTENFAMRFSECMDDDGSGSCENLSHDGENEHFASDYVYDLAAPRLVVHVGSDVIGGKPDVQVILTPDGVRREGGGCDTTVPFAT